MEDALTAGMSEVTFDIEHPLDGVTEYVRDLCRRAVTYAGKKDDDAVFNTAWRAYFSKGLHWPITMLVLYDAALSGNLADLDGEELPCSPEEEPSWAFSFASRRGVHKDIVRMFYTKNYEFQHPAYICGKVLY